MAEINYSALEGHIASGKPSQVYLICGDDGFLRRSALEMLKEKYKPDVLPEFNYTEFDGSECTVDEIAAAAETLPMMAERRLVVVKDMDAAAISADQYRKLESFLGSIGNNDGCVLIFFNVSVKASAKSGDKQGAMRALIKKNGTVINCKTPSPAEITGILLSEAAKNGTQLSRSDAAYMVERCGSDITNLLSELAKLHSLCGGKITRAAIDANTTQSVDVKAYMLASNVISGRRGDAYRIMEELFEEKTEPVAVLAIMSGAFIDLYRAKLASEQRKNADDMPALFGEEYKGKEKRLSFSFRDCRRYSPTLLRRWCGMLCDTDAALKSSRVDGKILMEKLLAEMFTAAEAAR
ncbi:MAG: DNA polymerase III subunit delta [Clostridia bacterium]|nr:DNA polymerase III subunit delta [Clostridia bacterium]